MDNITDIILDIDFNPRVTEDSFVKDTQNQYGQINNGPYLPIQSGNYSVDVISTSDFNFFEVHGHY